MYAPNPTRNSRERDCIPWAKKKKLQEAAVWGWLTQPTSGSSAQNIDFTQSLRGRVYMDLWVYVGSSQSPIPEPAHRAEIFGSMYTCSVVCLCHSADGHVQVNVCGHFFPWLCGHLVLFLTEACAQTHICRHLQSPGVCVYIKKIIGNKTETKTDQSHLGWSVLQHSAVKFLTRCMSGYDTMDKEVLSLRRKWKTWRDHLTLCLK